MIQRYFITIIILIIVIGGYLQFDNNLTITSQFQLIGGQLPEQFPEFVYLFSTLPRLAMAIMVGTVLGVVGSILQQLTRNPLLSPLTLGTSAGAWLALIIISIWLPTLSPNMTSIFVMLGSLFAMTLVLLIAGIRQLAGLPVILAGMAVSLLLGAITSALILLRDQYAKNLFIWGAGDLAQNDWEWMFWLAPKVIILLLLLVLAPRILSLLRLGQDSARARGLAITPVLLILFMTSIWLVSASITAVGVIGFIGLVCPNISRLMGANTTKDELYYSGLLGALILICADLLARLSSLYSSEIVPTGTATALIGAPILIWLTTKRKKAEDQLPLNVSSYQRIFNHRNWIIFILITCSSLILAMFFNQNSSGWLWQWPSEFEWDNRLPRIKIAFAAGICMAVAGTILQRLIHNPLASPDLLGVSAGATGALVITSMLTTTPLNELSPLVAFIGSIIILTILLLLSRKKGFSAANIILIGVSLTAIIEALIQFSLARGGQNVYSILGWLAGTTYRAESLQANFLLYCSCFIIVFSLISSRGLTLLTLGKDVASSQGLNVDLSTKALLIFVALCCALVTATLGPIAFIGLLAPHLASILGANKIKSQLILASILGASTLVLADWLGRNILYPYQIAAGTLASALGGAYFIFLLLIVRRRD